MYSTSSHMSLPGHVACVLGAEIGCTAGHLDWEAVPSKRDLSTREFGHLIVLPQSGTEASLDDAWRQTVHTDLFGRKLCCECLRQAEKGGLGYTVGSQQRERVVTTNRCHDEHTRIMTTTAKMRQGLTHQQVGRLHVHLEEFVPYGLFRVGESGHGRIDGRVAHQYVELAETFHGAFDQLSSMFGIGHVAYHTEKTRGGSRVEFGDVSDSGVDILLLSAADDHRSALGSESLCDRQSDACR
mmetsp:Transcript_4963/g.15149  ORF Transcript_4963/g.15149 Transcript_4963/m.15149 type:complete len:241 (-) Transcript_4963:2256-2978(-)